VKARSSRVDWFGGADQLVLGVAYSTETLGVTSDFGQMIIATLDQNLKPTVQSQTGTPGNGCLYDLALGNFDQQNADGTRNLNLQWRPSGRQKKPARAFLSATSRLRA
jgi:hypothetical protein